jgi:hypothetical protein
VPGEVGVQEAE